MRIGKATITNDSSSLLSDGVRLDIPAGFYALAYDLSSAGIAGLSGTVISYRGTNFNGSFLDFFNSPLWADMRSGWSVGAGVAGAQAGLALDFYNAVKGESDPRYANITTTGHSLGGGLAGLAAALYGREAALFDSMAYEGIVSTIVDAAGQSQAARDRFYAGMFPWASVAGGISSKSTEGEILSVLPLAGDANARPVLHYGADLGAITGPVSLHSMAMMVSLLWADGKHTAWRPAAEEMWNGYFSETVAQSLLGIETRLGPLGNVLTVMQSAIAYSAIDSGERPFGDTGIWSMFNDADELGAVLAGNEAAFFAKNVSGGLIFGRKDVKQTLADMLVQYAGALALYDVEQAQDGKINTLRGAVDARDGILKLEGNILALDVSRVLWGEVLKSNDLAATKLTSDRLDPINLVEFRQAYFEQAEEQDFIAGLKKFFKLEGSSWDDAALLKLAHDTWNATTLDIYDRYHIATTDTATEVTLTARGCTPDIALGNKAQVDVYVGTAANETIVNNTQGHSLIITGGDVMVSAANDNDPLCTAVLASIQEIAA